MNAEFQVPQEKSKFKRYAARWSVELEKGFWATSDEEAQDILEDCCPQTFGTYKTDSFEILNLVEVDRETKEPIK